MRKPMPFHLRRLASIDRFTSEDPRELHALVEGAEGRRCRDADPEDFFPPDGMRFSREALAAERDRVEGLCRGCPVRQECLASALLRGETYGSWGGVAQPDFQVLARLWREQKQVAATVEDPAEQEVA
jgi:hypothetical protein